MGIVESRDKCFVLDLKLLFNIVNFFFAVHDIDMILIFVCFNKVYL